MGKGINMSNLDHLRNCTEQTDLLVSTVVAAAKTVKIVCFGFRRRDFKSWSCFVEESYKLPEFSFDLLVVVGEEERRQRFEVLNAIESAVAGAGIDATFCVHSHEAVCAAIAQGNTFFSKVCDSGFVLYEDISRPAPVMIARASVVEFHGAIDIWMRSYQLAGDFLAGALQFCSSGAEKIAAFMLHQTVEHTCIALIGLIIGYRPSTHSLRRLLAMTENFSDVGYVRFPCVTKEEAALFLKLSRAYSDVRYKDGFYIGETEARILVERVKGFYEDAGKIYSEVVAGRSLTRYYHQNINDHELKQHK